MRIPKREADSCPGRTGGADHRPAQHAQVARRSFARAGVSDRIELRVGKALDLLPQLVEEVPFDLVFIDANKGPYPQYLDWALRLTRPGSIIVADNCIQGGSAFRELDDKGRAGLVEYNKRIAGEPRHMSLALAMDDDYTDGFASIVSPGTTIVLV